MNRRLQDGGQDCDPNLLATASQNPDLSSIVQLFELAGLEEIFTCPGPFTGLFPTNAAFEQLDPAIVDFLLLPENVDALQGLLLYHLLPGAIFTVDLVAGPSQTLLDGEVVVVSLDPLTINDSGVVTPDVAACNGVIHVIDEVLLPLAPGKLMAVNDVGSGIR
jgi:uncharacterized surface protein with fasciclin (FAS1) repeats